MTLTQDEYRRMQALLMKQQAHRVLTPDEQAELRRLVTAENPGVANSDWNTIVTVGLVILGLYLLLRIFGDE